MTTPMAVLDLVWSLLALVGIGVTLGSLSSALGDRSGLKAAGLNGSLRIVAEAAIRRELVRLFVLAMFLATGVIAFFPGESASWIITIALFLNSALISVVSILDRRARQRILGKR